MGARRSIRSARAASRAPATTSATVKGLLNRFESALNAAAMTYVAAAATAVLQLVYLLLLRGDD